MSGGVGRAISDDGPYPILRLFFASIVSITDQRWCICCSIRRVLSEVDESHKSSMAARRNTKAQFAGILESPNAIQSLVDRRLAIGRRLPFLDNPARTRRRIP